MPSELPGQGHRAAAGALQSARRQCAVGTRLPAVRTDRSQRHQAQEICAAIRQGVGAAGRLRRLGRDAQRFLQHAGRPHRPGLSGGRSASDLPEARLRRPVAGRRRTVPAVGHRRPGSDRRGTAAAQGRTRRGVDRRPATLPHAQGAHPQRRAYRELAGGLLRRPRQRQVDDRRRRRRQIPQQSDVRRDRPLRAVARSRTSGLRQDDHGTLRQPEHHPRAHFDRAQLGVEVASARAADGQGLRRQERQSAGRAVVLAGRAAQLLSRTFQRRGRIRRRAPRQPDLPDPRRRRAAQDHRCGLASQRRRQGSGRDAARRRPPVG